MLDELVGLDYNPNDNITKYLGPYPINEINKVRSKVILDLKKDSKTKIEFEIKRKCAIFTKDLIDYMLNDKKPDGFVENSYSYDLKLNNTNPYIHRTLDIDQDDLFLPTEDQIQVENTLSVNKTPMASSSSDSSFKTLSQTCDKVSPINKQLSSSNSDEVLRLNRDLGLGVST